MMPRYDDRLDNVLELLSSEEHSNSDTVFRHISDILIQENKTLEGARRATIVGHLADIYPKTSQPARMEVMDIAARANDTVPELVSIAAADRSIVGTRIWDRVRMSSDSWQAILPALPKSVLGRLRARLDLPDDIVVSIDREWRERVKDSDYRIPTLPETLARLGRGFEKQTGGDAPQETTEQDRLVPENEEALFADVEQQLDDEDTALDLTDMAEDVDQEHTEANAPDVAASDDTPNTEPASIIERSGTQLRENANREDMKTAEVAQEDIADPRTQETQDTTAASDLFIAAAEDDEAGETETPEFKDSDDAPIDLTDVLGSVAASIKDPEKPLDDSADEDPALPESDEEDAELEKDEFALSEKPQVEDPKIQDILERLREFGSRSRVIPPAQDRTIEDSNGQESPNEVFAAIKQTELGDAEDGRSAALFEAAPDAQAPNKDTDKREDEPQRTEKSGAFMFLPEQPLEQDDEEDYGLPEPIVFDSAVGFQPLTVNGTTWVTDRFGTIAEFHSEQDEAFGLAKTALEGQILSSLFDAKSQQKLDQAMNSRRAFRDKSLISAHDSKTWMLSAVAVFDEESGIFLGHRGTATSLILSQPQAANDAEMLESVGALQPEPGILDVASLAHELKTPLNAIRGFAEMIETQQLGPASAFARHRSQRISQEADQLHHILTDLLLSKRSGGDGIADVSALKQALETALQSFQEHIDLRGLAVLDPHITTSLGDDLLKSILEKMIHNCALWTPAERNVTIDVALDDAANASICMALPGWMGGAGRGDLLDLSSGPRLSYRHPLLDKSFQGRGLDAVLDQATQAGARLFLRKAGRMDAALVLVLSIQMPG